MADPLSIAASIAGVISLADIVFIRTKKYLALARNADKEVKDLAQEVLLLGGALHSLSRLAQALDADGPKDQHIDNLRMHHIAACHATLDEVAKKLKKLEDSGTKRKAVWPFVSDRTKALLDEVSRHKEILNLALTADSMGALLQILSKSEEIHENTERILEEAEKTREIVTRIHQDSARKEILNYFILHNPQQNYEMSLSLRHPTTGLWLMHKLEFQTWLAQPDSALWLSGIPGAGKTVLAGKIIEETLKRGSEDTATAFFFCDYKNNKTQTTINVLSALASQLAIQKEEAYHHLDCYYQELHPERALRRRPDVLGLKRILKDMVKSFDHVYLVVDGLDECGDNTNIVVDDILDIIACSDNISTAFLSRDEDNIRDRLQQDFTGVQIAAHTEDIAEYVTSEIEKRILNKSLRIDDLSLKGAILGRLINGAKGMFRWVACQLDSLGDCLSDQECRVALDQLPPGLDESYLRILQRVPKGKEHLMQMILNFIAYASPRLETRFLMEALSVPEKIGRNDGLDSLSIIREDSITRLCRSLVRKSNDGYHYEFAHFSVQEFLEGEMMTLPGMYRFRISYSICECLLATQCLKYVLLREFSSLPTEKNELVEHIQTRDRQYPFYLYAAIRWPLLARDHWMDQGLLEAAKVLFRPDKSLNFTSWALEIMSYNLVSPGHIDCSQAPDKRHSLGRHHIRHIMRLLPQLMDRNFTTLHMAAALSLPVICSSLLKKVNINQRSCFGTPLQCALQGMFLAVSEYGNGEQINPYNRLYYRQNQSNCSHFGRANTTRLLLGAGANHFGACSSPFLGQTLITIAIKLACKMDDLDATTALLEGGVGVQEDDLDQFDSLRRFILVWRDRQGSDPFHIENLITCLSPMIDRSIGHFHLCQAAWSLAIEYGCRFTECPSDFNTRISLSQDALITTIFASIKCCDIKTLTKALKDPRACLTGLTDVWGETVWEQTLSVYESAPLNGLAVLKSLLAAGIEVNTPNDEGLLPIHEVASWISHNGVVDDDNRHFRAYCEIVAEFVRKGTGCNVRSRAKKNIFHYGLHLPNFVRAVLEIETEENIVQALKTRDEGGYTPISLALREGREEVALLLLRTSRCDPESLRCPASVHALCVAGGKHRAFNVLLDAGRGWDPADTSNATILHHVGPRTSKEFVLQLIGMFPGGLRLRVDNKLPLDIYLENCLDSEFEYLKPEVPRLLAVFGTDEDGQKEKKLVWENFALSVRSVRRLIEVDEEHTEDALDKINTNRELTVLLAISMLKHFGFVQSYEAVANAPGILPLLRPFPNQLSDLWPISSQDICKILEDTNLWAALRASAAATRLLKAAVKSCDIRLVEILLANDVDVHQRIDNLSPLELACIESAESLNDKRLFTLLLNHADASRLDEINPNRGQRKGLIHYLSGPEKQWRLWELLKRGIDVNMRTSFHVEAQPAIVQHLYERSLETAMILLEWGADPAMADSCGMDAALAAVTQGNMPFLLHLYTAESKNWQLDWKRSCTMGLTDAKGVRLRVSQANALHVAAEFGHCEVMRFYLDKRILTNTDAVSVELFTPLHVAAITGQVDAIEFLHSRGASLNLKAADGSLPLHLAVRNEHVEVVKFLVAQGSVMSNDGYGMSPVAYAVNLQNESILDCLSTTQQYLAYRSEPRRCAKDIAHAYEQALMRGNIEHCETLHSHGCPINIDLPRQNGRSALLLAVEQSNEGLIKWLLAHNAKATGNTFIANRGWTSPLEAMIMRPSLNDLLPLLLQKYQNEGGSINAHGPSLVCIAIAKKNNVGLKLLLDHIARHETIRSSESIKDSDFDRSAVNHHRLSGDAPLHFAARGGNCEAVKLLLDHGADIDVLDKNQMTPLQKAIASEPLKESPAAKLLLHYGAAVESRDQWGATAVLFASREDKAEMVSLLADAGADMKAADFASWSCLHFAANNGNLKTFAWLVNRGLQLHVKDAGGWSAIQRACFHGSLTSLLLNLGSTIDQIDPLTYTSYDLSSNGCPACLNQHFKLYSRRLGRDRLRELANLEPRSSWSPLCLSASIGQALAMKNLLQLRADVDFEGCPTGSALMAACSSGRVESVKMLVRHGAAISYFGASGFRSAVDCAKKHKAILAWLLVERFTDQKKLSSTAYACPSVHPVGEVKPWSGIAKAEFIITGGAERQVQESARDYWIRLMALKKECRGKVVSQNTALETHHPSRLVPEEPVRICPGDYGSSKEQK